MARMVVVREKEADCPNSDADALLYAELEFVPTFLG